MEEIAVAEEIAFAKFWFEDADESALNYGGGNTDGDEHHGCFKRVEPVDIVGEAVVSGFEVSESETGDEEENEKRAEGGLFECGEDGAESVFVWLWFGALAGFGEVEGDKNEIDEGKSGGSKTEIERLALVELDEE